MSPFQQKIIELVSMIPYGRVASYGQIALFAGLPRAAREVGWILKSTKADLPWWRVVNNQGKISIEGNWNADKIDQKKLLESEGVKINDDFTFDIERYRWKVSAEDVSSIQLPHEYIQKIIETYGI